jgi:predicted  nucleic acid-binding Zn-ribbon protein
MTSEDDLRDALAREMYWAEEAAPRSRMATGEVRDALHDFAALMRDDEKQVIPRGEPNLASTSRWRRQLKFRLFRINRPISWRYDRLLADLSELNAALADRVAVLEAEVARLRAEHDEKIAAFVEQTERQNEELASRRADRERMIAELPPTMKGLYSRISSRIRDGVAVAEARKNSCSACFMSLRPEMMAKIRRGDEIITCDNCSRILYYVPAEEQAQTTAS